LIGITSSKKAEYSYFQHIRIGTGGYDDYLVRHYIENIENIPLGKLMKVNGRNPFSDRVRQEFENFVIKMERRKSPVGQTIKFMSVTDNIEINNGLSVT
jgi:hypothetical protein